MRSTALYRARLCLEPLAERCLLSTFTLGPTVRVSHGDPFAACTADTPSQQSGTLYPGTSLENWLAVDPNDPNHLVGAWQQDRWSGGGARGIGVGVSVDGGSTWYDLAVPNLTKCTGGTSFRASDPWVAISSSGEVYLASLLVTSGGAPGGAVVQTSYDGGYSWNPPVAIPNSSGADKESITTDPSNPNIAYVVYTGAYSRTTDGGVTWSAARSLPTGSGSQVVVLPDGTLVDSDGCEVFRSTDQGQSWSNVIPIYNCNPQSVTDPNTRQPLRAGLGLGDLAVDPNSGELYVVIEDATVGGGGHDRVAFTTSVDGGLHWTTPVAVNQTPTNIPQLDQQAFLPTVTVAGDGTVGVTYYDFRNNPGGSTLPTDYWFVPGTPDGTGNVTWGAESRITKNSFDFELAPFSKYGKFIGDYQGRAGDGNDIVELFAHPTLNGKFDDAIYFRRLINLGNDTDTAVAGDVTSTDVTLAAALRGDGAVTTTPVADPSAVQVLPVDAALAGLLQDRADSAAPWLMHDDQGLRHAAPAYASDAAMPALLLDDTMLSAANGTSLNPASL